MRDQNLSEMSKLMITSFFSPSLKFSRTDVFVYSGIKEIFVNLEGSRGGRRDEGA